jgi:hypothetical protein
MGAPAMMCCVAVDVLACSCATTLNFTQPCALASFAQRCAHHHAAGPMMIDNTLHDVVPPNSLFPLFAKDKDPQLILQDLDKGLRSQKIHEQYESLLFFIKLINQYPQAVVVNTAYMKLSDLFRVRYEIKNVFQANI